MQAFRFFDREAERKQLETYLKRPPATILVLLGPRSSGKTALLQEVLLHGSLSAKGFQPSYLDARAQQVTDPGVMVSLLQEQGRTILDVLRRTFKNLPENIFGGFIAAMSSSNIGDLIQISDAKLIEAIKGKEHHTINDVIKGYDCIFEAYKSEKRAGNNWPIICIDEANVLREWKFGTRDRQEALGALLRFFVKACVLRLPACCVTLLQPPHNSLCSGLHLGSSLTGV